VEFVGVSMTVPPAVTASGVPHACLVLMLRKLMEEAVAVSEKRCTTKKQILTCWLFYGYLSNFTQMLVFINQHMYRMCSTPFLTVTPWKL
jgi:hypothetical protein